MLAGPLSVAYEPDRQVIHKPTALHRTRGVNLNFSQKFVKLGPDCPIDVAQRTPSPHQTSPRE